MTRRPTPTRTAGDELACRFLTEYSKYADLLARQMAALDQDDVDAVEALSRTGAEMRASISELGPPSGVWAGAPKVAERVSEILKIMRQRGVAIERRLSGLRREATERIKGLDRGRSAAGRYLAPTVRARGEFDLRL